MTATLTYERLNHHTCSFPYEQIQATYGKSYYKLYQLKLRQLLTANPFQREDHEKAVKQKQMNDKRSSQEYVNKILNDDHGKRTKSAISIKRRRTKDSMMYTITSTEVSTGTTIVAPKSIVKTRQSSS
jgi:hypothetical protein